MFLGIRLAEEVTSHISKKVMMVTGGAGARRKDTPSISSDWNKCIICQVDKKEQPIRCPANSTRV